MQNTILTSTPPTPYQTVRIARLADQTAVDQTPASPTWLGRMVPRAAGPEFVIFAGAVVLFVVNAVVWSF